MEFNERLAEQLLAHVAECYPSHWKRLYDNLVEAGFSEAQAMEVFKTYILSMGVNGVNLNGR